MHTCKTKRCTLRFTKGALCPHRCSTGCAPCHSAAPRFLFPIVAIEGRLGYLKYFHVGTPWHQGLIGWAFRYLSKIPILWCCVLQVRYCYLLRTFCSPYYLNRLWRTFTFAPSSSLAQFFSFLGLWCVRGRDDDSTEDVNCQPITLTLVSTTARSPTPQSRTHHNRPEWKIDASDFIAEDVNSASRWSSCFP